MLDKPFCKLKENRFKKRTNKQQKHDTNILEIFKVNPIKALIKLESCTLFILPPQP